MTREATEILNPQLVDLIREYALTNIDYSVYPNFLSLTKEKENEIVIFKLHYASNLIDLLEPNVTYILRLNDLYVAFKDFNNTDQLSNKKISSFLKSKFPKMYEDFRIYHKRLKKNDETSKFVLTSWLTGEDIWILKFKDGKLISKDITK